MRTFFVYWNIPEREWFWTLKKYTYTWKALKFSRLKKNGIFNLLDVETNHQSWETVLVTKIYLCQKKQKHLLKQKQKTFDTKKHNVQDLLNAPSVLTGFLTNAFVSLSFPKCVSCAQYQDLKMVKYTKLSYRWPNFLSCWQ